MNNKSSQNRRDALILILGNLVQVITAIVSVKIITSILSPLEMGRMAIILSLLLFFNFFFNGISAYIQRNLIIWDSNGLAGKYVFKFIRYLFAMAIIGVIGLILMKKTIGIGLKMETYWVGIIFFGLLFFTHLNNGFMGWLNLFKKRLYFVSFSTLTLWIGLFLSLIFIQYMPKSAETWLLGQISGQVIILFFSGFVFFKLLKSSKAFYLDGKADNKTYNESPKPIFKFVWPISIAALIMWIQQSSYRFILEQVSGIEVVGLFTVGFGLGLNYMNRCEALFNQFYHPIFYKEIATDDLKKRTMAWNDYAYYLMPTTLIIALYIVFGSPFIARVFLGESFYDVAKKVIVWGVLSQLSLIFMTLYSMAGIIQQKTKDFILPNAVGAIVILVGLMTFLKSDPYWGAGISLSMGSLTSLFIMKFKMKKLLPISFPKRRILLTVFISLPMIAILLFYRQRHPMPDIIQSLISLSVAGVYMMFVQIFLFKQRLSLPDKLYPLNRVKQKIESYFY